MDRKIRHAGGLPLSLRGHDPQLIWVRRRIARMSCLGRLPLSRRSALTTQRIRLLRISFAAACVVYAGAASAAQNIAERCPRPPIGSDVPEPKDLRSRDGVLELDLTVRNDPQKDGSTRYCYVLPDGTQAPTLRLHPSDLLILRLTNDLKDAAAPAAVAAAAHQHPAARQSDPCVSGAMTATSTNLHFHGLTVPPVCHQDEVLKTSIQPDDAPFEYRFRIPANESPGLYWYHPHIHGFSTKQVLGGASGAIVIEGMERANPEVAGLPERVMVIRDQDLLNPDAPPSKSEPVVPKAQLDSDGDAGNNDTGFGKPAKDLSINYVPVPYPDYPPATLRVRPGERQLWRVLNASAVTYLHLALLFDKVPQPLGVVAIDGAPVNAGRGSARTIAWADHIGVPPGGRVEFIITGPPAGVPGLLITRSVDTGQGGENDPNRALARVIASANAAEPHSRLPSAHEPLPASSLPWLGDVPPVRVRKLYFSEARSEPENPQSPTAFFITIDGQTPAPFDPRSEVPNIVVKQGDVEDWIIENRSVELHAFHIHQIHFLLLDWFGMPVNEPFLRDTVNVPYFDNRMLNYPSVRLRMDFRDPNAVGTFVYHCHLLEHEDGGMMGAIRVEPQDGVQTTQRESRAIAAGTSDAGVGRPNR
jgi:FtsP/CotA-like multicopper oxidase with cupredoxin domain